MSIIEKLPLRPVAYVAARPLDKSAASADEAEAETPQRMRRDQPLLELRAAASPQFNHVPGSKAKANQSNTAVLDETAQKTDGVTDMLTAQLSDPDKSDPSAFPRIRDALRPLPARLRPPAR